MARALEKAVLATATGEKPATMSMTSLMRSGTRSGLLSTEMMPESGRGCRAAQGMDSQRCGAMGSRVPARRTGVEPARRHAAVRHRADDGDEQPEREERECERRKEHGHCGSVKGTDGGAGAADGRGDGEEEGEVDRQLAEEEHAHVEPHEQHLVLAAGGDLALGEPVRQADDGEEGRREQKLRADEP
eukprot:5943375-Prymnesium_polylepis.1